MARAGFRPGIAKWLNDRAKGTMRAADREKVTLHGVVFDILVWDPFRRVASPPFGGRSNRPARPAPAPAPPLRRYRRAVPSGPATVSGSASAAAGWRAPLRQIRP